MIKLNLFKKNKVFAPSFEMIAENELKSVSGGVTTDGTEGPTTESMKTENLVYDEEKFKEIAAHAQAVLLGGESQSSGGMVDPNSMPIHNPIPNSNLEPSSDSKVVAEQKAPNDNQITMGLEETRSHVQGISAHGGKEHEYKWELMSPEKLFEEQSAEMENQHEQIAKNNETELQNLREQEAKGMLEESQSEVEQSGLIGASAW